MSMLNNKNSSKSFGFTIVELLIVIVVIGILAAISIVTYNGIQNRAHDTIVKDELVRFAKQIQLLAADKGDFPRGGRITSDGTNWTGSHWEFPGFEYQISKQSYGNIVNNLSYCTGTSASGGQPVFRVISQSKSGRYLEYNSSDGLKDRGMAWIPIYGHNLSTLCADMNEARSYSYGWNNNNSTWAGWIKG